MNNNTFIHSFFDGSFLTSAINPIMEKIRTPNTAIKKINKKISVMLVTSFRLSKKQSNRIISLTTLSV